MRKISLIAVMVFALSTIFSSCTKKQVQDKVEDIIVKVMIDGIWIVTKYEEGGVDQTNLFTDWESQFFENKTCIVRHAINGTVYNGTWDGSYPNQTMTGNFSNAAPINKMNGTWRVVKSNYTVGEFSRIENGSEIKLHIRKK